MFFLVAFFAPAELPKTFPRIYAVVVTVAEHEFHAVAPHVFGAEHRQIVGDRPRIEDSQAGNFAHAIRAHTLGTQVLDRIHTYVAVVPTHGDLTGSGLLYF